MGLKTLRIAGLYCVTLFFSSEESKYVERGRGRTIDDVTGVFLYFLMTCAADAEYITLPFGMHNLSIFTTEAIIPIEKLILFYITYIIYM